MNTVTWLLTSLLTHYSYMRTHQPMAYDVSDITQSLMRSQNRSSHSYLNTDHHYTCTPNEYYMSMYLPWGVCVRAGISVSVRNSPHSKLMYEWAHRRPTPMPFSANTYVTHEWSKFETIKNSAYIPDRSLNRNANLDARPYKETHIHNMCVSLSRCVL